MSGSIRNTINGILLELSGSSGSVDYADGQIEKYALQFSPVHAIGNCCSFIIDIPSARYLYIGRNIEKILGFTSAEILGFGAGDLAGRLLMPEQAVMLSSLLKDSMGVLMKEYAGQTDIEVNIDSIILRKNGKEARLLVQFRPLEWSDYRQLMLVGGYFIDISPYKKEGPPIVTINRRGELLATFENRHESIVSAELTDFTKKEMELLQMIASGASTDDIILKTGLSKATIYSHRRNILAKSAFSSISKEIQSLKSRGLLK